MIRKADFGDLLPYSAFGNRGLSLHYSWKIHFHS